MMNMLDSSNHNKKRKCDNCGKVGAMQKRITRIYGCGENTLVIENVPVIVCPHCGASYLEAKTLHEIEREKAALLNDDIRPEYDLKKLRGGVQGKYYKAYRQGHTVKIHKADGTIVVQHFQFEKEEIIKKSQHDPDMLDKYDFSGGIRGKYVKRLADGSNIVIKSFR